MKHLLCKPVKPGINLKVGAENESWIHAVENSRSILDDPELQLIVKVKVKMLCENLKTPIWHFDNGWRQLIYLFLFWGVEFEILQHITYTY